MFQVEGVAKRVVVAIISMPLLTELVSCENSFCYRHGAPNGAVFPSQHRIPPKTAKKLNNVALAAPVCLVHRRRSRGVCPAST